MAFGRSGCRSLRSGREPGRSSARHRQARARGGKSNTVLALLKGVSAGDTDIGTDVDMDLDSDIADS